MGNVLQVGFNEDEQCISSRKCPPGYGILDDDETGKCYKNSDIKKCPDAYITHKDDECPKPIPPICHEGTTGTPPNCVIIEPPGEGELPPEDGRLLPPTLPTDEEPSEDNGSSGG